ncbi:MAG: ATP-binding protein, partial [Desulfobacterales bacterium]
NKKTEGDKYFQLAIEHSEDKDSSRLEIARNIFATNPYSQEGIDILKEINDSSPQYKDAFGLLTLNLSPKEYWQMFSKHSESSLRDSEMLNRSIYHKIKNEISILKDIVYEIISDYPDKEKNIFTPFIENINHIIKGIEERRGKEKEQIKEIPRDKYEEIIRIISETAHDISDFVNNELAVMEADVREVLSENPPQNHAEIKELLNQIKITQGALNDLKAINEGIKIIHSRFQVKELFENWANTPKLRNAEISLHIENGESVFNGDEKKIKSFLNELIENAMKHNEYKEDLRICISSKDIIDLPDILGNEVPGNQKYLFITCQDNGKGIPPDRKSTIFLPLETTSDTSTGLGLFIIKRTLQEMNGYIRETGENGANFEIYIPYINGESH